MDWSKKIGILTLLVLVLAACSSRKNYGSVYFANGDVFNDNEIGRDLSVSDYIEYADSVNNDIRSLNHYENEVKDSVDTTSSVEEIGSLDSLLTEDNPNRDTVFVESVELQKIDSSSMILNDSIKDLKVEEYLIVDSLEFVKNDSLTNNADSIQVTSDSLNKAVIDSIKVKIAPPSNSVLPENMIKKASDSTKIIYTDTVGVIREKELENNTDAKTESQTRDNESSSKVKNVVIVNQEKENSNNDKPISDSTKNNTESIEKSNLENKDQSQKTQNSEKPAETKKHVETKKAVAVVPIITTEKKEIKTDTVTIIKENPSYKKEIDSLTLLNEGLRLKSKTDVSTIDTLVYSVFFDTSQKNLGEGSKEILRTLISDANQKSYVLQLAGHTDKSGSASFNKTLSEQRVKSVLDFLVANGLDERKIYFQSFGANYATSQSDLNMRIVSCRLIVDN